MKTPLAGVACCGPLRPGRETVTADLATAGLGSRALDAGGSLSVHARCLLR